MNITTKYKTLDTLRCVDNNKAYSFEVEEIGISITEKGIEITYYDKGSCGRIENEVVGSREELINLL